MYITINNEKYELTLENILELNRQEAIETAINAMRNVADYVSDVEQINTSAIENLTENDFVEIGNDILNRVFSNSGSIEFDVLERYGIIKED